jgi:hypothetical protein
MVMAMNLKGLWWGCVCCGCWSLCVAVGLCERVCVCVVVCVAVCGCLCVVAGCSHHQVQGGVDGCEGRAYVGWRHGQRMDYTARG